MAQHDGTPATRRSPTPETDIVERTLPVRLTLHASRAASTRTALTATGRRTTLATAPIAVAAIAVAALAVAAVVVASRLQLS